MAATCAKNSLEGQADMRKGASAHAEHVGGQEVCIVISGPLMMPSKLCLGFTHEWGFPCRYACHKVGDGGAVAPAARGVRRARLYLPLQHDFSTQQVGIRS